jgi:nitrogen fixation protein FixH
MKKKLIIFFSLALLTAGGIVIAQTVIANNKKNRMVAERTEKQTNKMADIYALTPAQKDAIFKVNEEFQKNLADLVAEHKGAPNFEVREEAILYSHEQNAFAILDETQRAKWLAAKEYRKAHPKEKVQK